MPQAGESGSNQNSLIGGMKRFPCQYDLGSSDRARCNWRTSPSRHIAISNEYLYEMSSKDRRTERPCKVTTRTRWNYGWRVSVLLCVFLLLLALPRGSAAAPVETPTTPDESRESSRCIPCPSSCTCTSTGAGELCKIECFSLQGIPDPSHFPLPEYVSHM